jgi:hypothetical protein
VPVERDLRVLMIEMKASWVFAWEWEADLMYEYFVVSDSFSMLPSAHGCCIGDASMQNQWMRLIDLGDDRCS